jgi:Cof subfamily protein (haloacid dehalogenase superfamily)
MDGMKHDLSEILDFIDREQGFYEIVPKGYSKATAIRYITEYLNIPMEDTVAIGDSNNDLPMLQYAHTSIAMGNSSKQVLEVADYITTDVDKDGIWNALKWLGVLDK